MDSKQLVDKFVSGEITEEQFDAENSKFTPEEQTKVNEELAKQSKELRKEVIGLRGAKKAISEKNDSDLTSRLRQENFDSAKASIFTELGIEKDEDKKAFEEGFKKFDSGAVNSVNIIKDMKSYYASTKSDEFFDLKQKQKSREAEAEEYNAQNAGANGSAGGEDPTKKVSADVKAIMEASRKSGRVLTVAEAEKRLELIKNRGHLK